MNTLPVPSEFTVLGKTNLFSQQTYQTRVPHGLTIRQVLGSEGDEFAVALDDEPIPPWQWDWRKPLPGQQMLVVAIPRDDGMRTLLLTAGIIAAAVFAGPALPAFMGMSTSTATAFWQASIMAIGSLAMTALVVPPRIDA